MHCTLAPRIYEGGARRARGVPHPDAEKFLFEAVFPDFGLKQLPGWVGSSHPSVRTGVLRIMVRLPLAIVYDRFAARSTTELWSDCPRQSFMIDSLRGAPPPGEAKGAPAPVPNTNLSFCCFMPIVTIPIYRYEPISSASRSGGRREKREVL